MKARIRKPELTHFEYVYCDDCKHEFLMNSVNIEEATIDIEGQVLTLVYFACPKCNKIYKVLLKDDKYNELHDDFENTKLRVQKNFGSGKKEFASTLNSMLAKKQERLNRHIDKLNKTFSGTFTFEASENNPKEKIVKYLP